MRFIPRFSITNAIAAVLTVIDGRMAVAAEGVGAGNANPPVYLSAPPGLRPGRPVVIQTLTSLFSYGFPLF